MQKGLKNIISFPFKKTFSKSGFSLVEMIVYVAIFSIMFTVILNLFWRVQLSGSRSQIANEVKENTAQVLQLITASVRQGVSIDELASLFDSDPGVLVVNDDEILVFDTYTKNVNVGGISVEIRKLRLTQGGGMPVDLTSDRVNVDHYQLTNLSPAGTPDTIGLDLSLSNINPGADPDFDSHLSVRTAITVRKEI